MRHSRGLRVWRSDCLFDNWTKHVCCNQPAASIPTTLTVLPHSASYFSVFLEFGSKTGRENRLSRSCCDANFRICFAHSRKVCATCDSIWTNFFWFRDCNVVCPHMQHPSGRVSQASALACFFLCLSSVACRLARCSRRVSALSFFCAFH